MSMSNLFPKPDPARSTAPATGENRGHRAVAGRDMGHQSNGQDWWVTLPPGLSKIIRSRQARGICLESSVEPVSAAWMLFDLHSGMCAAIGSSRTTRVSDRSVYSSDLIVICFGRFAPTTR